MTDVYKNCPIFENKDYMLRLVSKEDQLDLLRVYSDQMAVPFFNSDNCNGDDFYYTTESRMEQAIDFWSSAYQIGGFVRWSILSKRVNQVIGTIELFNRVSNDFYTNCGLLRLDLRSDFEITHEIITILNLIIEPAYTLFQCHKIATKAIPAAAKRIEALKKLGFEHRDERLIGHDGTGYDSYFVLNRN